MEIQALLNEIKFARKESNKVFDKTLSLKEELCRQLVGHTLCIHKNKLIYVYKSRNDTLYCIQISPDGFFPHVVIDYSGVEEYLYTVDVANNYFKELIDEYREAFTKLDGIYKNSANE